MRFDQPNNQTIIKPIDQINFRFYPVILVLFVTTWISSDIAAIKLVNVFGITLTGGFIAFPFTTMFGNVIAEVYGYKNARLSIWLGTLADFIFVVSLYIVCILPPSDHWSLNNEFKTILFPGMRIVLASVVSLFIAEFLNSYLMAKMKINSNGRSLFKRVFVSCALSFFIDIVLYLTLAFYAVLPTAILISMIMYAYLKKIICQLLLYPVARLIIQYLKRIEKVDIFDYQTDFSPFSSDNIYDIKCVTRINAENKIINCGIGDHVIV